MKDFIKLTGRPKGKRYAIPDIHGCYKTFRYLVEERIKLSQGDWLFLLGDYVDRGPSSKAVLDYIMDLMDNGYSIFPLRGNHEEDLLQYANEEERFLLWHLKKHQYTEIVQDGKITSPYLDFLNSLPYYFELDDYYLVHAGFNFNSGKPFEDRKAMLWNRYSNPPEDLLNGRRIIHGHDPVYISIIKEHIEKNFSTIPLDNGVVYTGRHKIFDTSQLGRLCAFEMDSHQLFTQENIDVK